MHFLLSTFVATTALLIHGATAGAGAKVNLCVWFDIKPVEPIDVLWHTCGSKSHCMYCKEKNITMTVENRGLTCKNIGKVESKSSSSGGDTCATDKSHWELSYDAGPYNGSTLSDWHGGGPAHNSINLEKGKTTPGTSVCDLKSPCLDTKTDWNAGSAPDRYFLFRPQQNEDFTRNEDL